MINITFIVIFFSCSNPYPEATDTEITVCKKCDIQAVVTVENNLGHLKEEDAYLFLCSFSEECKNNAEFKEYSNEILFQLLANESDLFIKSMAVHDDLERENIYEELKYPINDTVDIQTIINNLKSSTQQGYNGVRDKTINALQMALEK